MGTFPIQTVDGYTADPVVLVDPVTGMPYGDPAAPGIPVATSPTDRFGNGTRRYNYAASTRTAVAATSSAAVALGTAGPSREYMFHANTRCFVRFGDVNVGPATVGANQLILEPGERFHAQLDASVTHFRVIRETTDGFLSVYPVA